MENNVACDLAALFPKYTIVFLYQSLKQLPYFLQIEGTKFEDIDLSDGEFAEYDEKGECPVMISKLKATFDLVK